MLQTLQRNCRPSALVLSRLNSFEYFLLLHLVHTCSQRSNTQQRQLVTRSTTGKHMLQAQGQLACGCQQAIRHAHVALCRMYMWFVPQQCMPAFRMHATHCPRKLCRWPCALGMKHLVQHGGVLDVVADTRLAVRLCLAVRAHLALACTLQNPDPKT